MPNTPCGAESGARASADRRDVTAILQRHVVAAEHDEVGPLAHQRGDGVRDVFVRDPETAMHVGDETDPQSGECAADARPARRRA